ncbi:MAG TPA: bifunctional hydroxymethylpyrimidine kinase/phosphomethylpyrimidine kinase [Candidatus Aminicenantes bacterium]|nr:bifunctional hydroxymethylpyrimidine kinase/phosphomethylpyrimidine kinase [Candidatus Aminicenantes bacterium]
MRRDTVALTIAGSDSGGGAGIQADLKTFSACGVFGTSVITAVTAQNLDGVYAIQAVDADMVRRQLRAVLDGFPVTVAKTGMLFSKEIIEVVAKELEAQPHIPLVVDPVFAATSGGRLICDDAIESLRTRLFPRAFLITPNIPEAEALLNESLDGEEHLEAAAQTLFQRIQVPILLKGGHLQGRAVDVLATHAGIKSFSIPMVRGVNNHGSGCTFASAAAAWLARGAGLEAAVAAAKEYTSRTLIYSLSLGPNIQVINHFWRVPDPERDPEHESE